MGWRSASSWLLGLAVMAAVPLSQGPRGVAPSVPIAAKAEDKGRAAKDEAKEHASQASSPWDGPARLVWDVTGEKKWDGVGDAKEQWLQLATRAQADGFSLSPLIALVPCPLDSNLSADFDQAIAALQAAYADAGYLLAGWWLPWSGDPAEDRLREQVPGLLVFRRYDRRELAVVLVVGEVPARGVHRAAFHEAVAGIRSWQAALRAFAAVDDTVRVLGPALSDSALSLRLSLEEWSNTEGLSFEVETGSARPRGDGDVGWSDVVPPTRFHSMIASELALQTRARQFFTDVMGWNIGVRQEQKKQMALLTEVDGAYGEPYLTRANARSAVLVRFPPGIAGLLSAWDRDQRPKDNNAAPGVVPVPDATLDLRLSDRRRPVLVPELSALTAPSRDLALGNLLETLADHRVSYVGVLASDSRDAIFLVDRIRRFTPGSLLFVVGNDLVFTHPKLAPTMNGVLVLSGFPLSPADGPFRPVPPGEEARSYLSQFTSDVQEGTYLAARRLIAGARGEKVPSETLPRVWISVVGNGSLWPLAALGPGDPKSPAEVCPLAPWSSPDRVAPRGALSFSAQAGAKLLVSALVLLGLTLLLERFAIPPRGAGSRTWWLLAAAALVLALAAGALAALGSLPYRRLGAGFSSSEWRQVVTALVLLVTAADAMAIVVRSLGARKPLSALARLGVFALLSLLSVGALYGLDQALCRLWMLGGAGFFLRRAFVFSSGLSPLVSLAWLGGSLYFWAFVELRRERMQARQEIDWPGEGPSIPAFERCREAAVQLRQLLNGPWPQWTGLTSWWVKVLPIFLAALLLLLLVTVHPIAEPRLYGRIFLVLLTATFFLGTYSFCRFVGAWRILERMLEQIVLPHPPSGIDKELAGLVGWSPMKSFGWQIPRFTMPLLAADQIRVLAESGRVAADLPGQIDASLERALEAYRDGDFEKEIKARTKLSEYYSAAYRQLAAEPADDPEAQRLIALRLVSYVRYVFAHLRGCLIAAGACGFPLLVAASTYAFEPNEVVCNGIWIALLVAVLVTLFIFFRMERNTLLSLISGSTPEKIQPNLALIRNVVTYGVVPLLGLIAAQFPQVGRYVVSLINPLLRVVGGGL